MADLKRDLIEDHTPDTSSTDSYPCSSRESHGEHSSKHRRSRYTGTGKLTLPAADPNGWPPVGEGTLLLDGEKSGSRTSKDPRQVAVYLHVDPSHPAPAATPQAEPQSPESFIHMPEVFFDKPSAWRYSVAAYLDNSYDFCPPFGNVAIYAALLLAVILLYVGTVQLGSELSPRWAINWIVVAPSIVVFYLMFGESAKVTAIASYFTDFKKKLA